MKIVPGKRYTRAEIAAMRDDPELAKLVLWGYVLRAELDGTMSFVHYSQTAFKKGGAPDDGKVGGVRSRGQDGVRTDRTWRNPAPQWDLPPIQKRTPQERMASLMEKVGEDIKHLRRTDSGEEARDMAQDAIELAHKQDEAAQAKQVVRRAPSE